MRHATKKSSKQVAQNKREEKREQSLKGLGTNGLDLAPPLSNPEQWFEFIDKGHRGFITLEEFIIAATKFLRPKTKSGYNVIRERIEGSVRNTGATKFRKQEFLENRMLDVVHVLDMEMRRATAHIRREQSTGQIGLNGQARLQARSMSASNSNNGEPSLRFQPEKWFDFYAKTYGGSLSSEDLVNGLISTLKPANDAEKQEIEESVSNMWHVYDSDYTGTIDKYEFLSKDGMYSALVIMEQEWKKQSDVGSKHLVNLYKKELTKLQEKPPSLTTSPEAWFEYFDLDGNGYLSQREVLCGLYVSLNATTKEKQTTIRKRVAELWNSCENIDKSGSISEESFLESELLIQALIELEKVWLSSEEDNQVIRVNIPIPPNMRPGSLIQAMSPKTNELCMLMIPHESKWNRDGDKYYFTFLF